MEGVFSYLGALTERDIRCIKNPPMTLVHSNYTALIVFIMIRKMLNGLKAAELTRFRDNITVLTRLVLDTSQDHYDGGIFILNFHVLDRLKDDRRRPSSMKTLDASELERYNLHAKRVDRHILQRPSNSKIELVGAMNQDMKDTVTASNVQVISQR